MLNQLRTFGTNVLAKILLALLVLSFAVWGIEDMVLQSGRGASVAKVGNTAVTTEEFARELRRQSDSLRQQMGGQASPEMLKQLGVPQRVLQQLISYKLIQLESESLGIIPGNAEVVRNLRRNPMFHDAKGTFDKSRFDSFLRSGNMSEKTYIDQLRRGMAASLLVGTLDAATPVPETALATLLAAAEEQRAATFYVLSPSAVSGVPAPSDDQAEAWYKDHAQEFTVPEYRTISYVTLSAADATAPAGISEEELKAAYQERIEEFRHPERRAVEQLLYTDEEKARAAHELLTGGKSFAQVAKKTDILNKNALSLGKIEKSGVIEEASGAVFALKENEFTDPVESGFGWHIFRVTAIEPPSVAPFAEVRARLEKEMKQQSGGDALTKMANKLEDDLAGGAGLKEAAEGLKLKVRTLGPVSSDGHAPDGSKVTVPEFDKFLETAFKTEEKAESPLLTAKGGLYYILRVDSVAPERMKPLADVRAAVIAGWQKEERIRLLGALSQKIAAAFANPATREAVMDDHNFQITIASVKRDAHKAGDLALTPGLLGDLFTRKPGEATGAYPLADGNYALAVVDKIIPADAPDKEALAELRRKLENSVKNEIYDEYLRHLAKKYSVSVNENALNAIVN